MIKTCHLCKKTLELSFFGKDRTTRDGHTYACKECRNKREKEYNKKNPDSRKRINDKAKPKRQEYYAKPENKAKYKNQQLKKTYGISLDLYNAILLNQLGVCAICEKPEKNKRLAVDHCHETGNIRGLLCSNCNRAIGLLKDSIELLNNGVKYLQKAKDEN